VSAVGDWKNPQKRIVNVRTFWVYISRMWGEETPEIAFGYRDPGPNYVYKIW